MIISFLKGSAEELRDLMRSLEKRTYDDPHEIIVPADTKFDNGLLRVEVESFISSQVDHNKTRFEHITRYPDTSVVAWRILINQTS